VSSKTSNVDDVSVKTHKIKSCLLVLFSPWMFCSFLKFLTNVETLLQCYEIEHLSWILTFTVAKHDTTSTVGAFGLSIFWTCSLKATTNDCKCLSSFREFPKNVSEQQLVCRWTWSMNVKLVTFETFLAN